MYRTWIFCFVFLFKKSEKFESLIGNTLGFFGILGSHSKKIPSPKIPRNPGIFDLGFFWEKNLENSGIWDMGSQKNPMPKPPLVPSSALTSESETLRFPGFKKRSNRGDLHVDSKINFCQPDVEPLILPNLVHVKIPFNPKENK